jgi:hypothetical protein
MHHILFGHVFMAEEAVRKFPGLSLEGNQRYGKQSSENGPEPPAPFDMLKRHLAIAPPFCLFFC